MHDVVFAATEKDSVYAFDADTGAVLWHVSVLAAGEDVLPPNGCDQVTPTIGITATPVIDRSAGANGIIYIVAMSRTTASSTYHQRLHALDVTTGAEALNGPVDISATYPMLGGTTTFDPAQYEERAALLLSHGVIYTSWTSHCDIRPYSGWIIAYSQSTLARSAVFNAAPNSAGAGPAIWMSGGGPAADSAGNVYVLTANGAFETALDSNGFPDRGDYGKQLSEALDCGRHAHGGRLLHPVQRSERIKRRPGSGIGWHPAATGCDGLRGRRASPRRRRRQGRQPVRRQPRLAGQVQPQPQQYLAASVGRAQRRHLFHARLLQRGRVLWTGWRSPHGFHRQECATLERGVIDHDQYLRLSRDFAGGIRERYRRRHHLGTRKLRPAVLHAYDAGNLGHELYNSSQAAGGRDHFGAGNKFITPMIADGKVFVGTQGGVAVFGLLN